MKLGYLVGAAGRVPRHGAPGYKGYNILKIKIETRNNEYCSVLLVVPIDQAVVLYVLHRF